MTSLPVFSAVELGEARRLMTLRVATMMGRKLEEDDWTSVYCAAKKIPLRAWSNVNIDVLYPGLGVEQKMLKYSRPGGVTGAFGKKLMHPSMTRAFRLPDISDPQEAMSVVFEGYSRLVKDRYASVEKESNGEEVSLRLGWLLWEESLENFLYFEEPMTAPDPADYCAEWHRGSGGAGRRLASKSLWIFENKTGDKRYSVTTEAGGKIQPYFDVPLATDENVVLLSAIGEADKDGAVATWVTRRTANSLRRAGIDVTSPVLSSAIVEACQSFEEAVLDGRQPNDQEGVAVRLEKKAHDKLVETFGTRNVDQALQTLENYFPERSAT